MAEAATKSAGVGGTADLQRLTPNFAAVPSAMWATPLGAGRLRAAGKGHLGDPHGRDLGDQAFDADDLFAGRRPDGGFKMVEATRFEAGHRT